MIILDLLKFFSAFPDRDGVLDLFANGQSSLPGYRELQRFVHLLPAPLIPEIKYLVFGQSLEAVKSRVAKIGGTYMFVDFGEFSCQRDRQNNIKDTQRMAVTIAAKRGNAADCVEEALLSDLTLRLANEVRARMLTAPTQATWLQYLADSHTIVPFESKELTSLGWSIMFNIEASDWFDFKQLVLSFQKNE